MPASHPHQLLRQLSQPTESASTSAMSSAWLSQSSPGPCVAATATNPPMSSSSSSSSSSWPGHSAVATAAEMPVLIRQSPVNIKQDTPADVFQPPPSGTVQQRRPIYRVSRCGETFTHSQSVLVAIIPHHNHFTTLSGTTRMSRCQKRTSGFYGAYIDHPAGRHSIQTNQCPPPPPSPYKYIILWLLYNIFN